jgi:hypothetical protein
MRSTVSQLWVGHRPFADSSGQASSRRSLTGQELPLVVANRLAAMSGKADGEPRARTVTQQPLQLGPVLACDAYRCVQRKATVVPGEHVADIIGIEQAVPGEPAQHAAADLPLFDHGNRFWRQRRGPWRAAIRLRPDLQGPAATGWSRPGPALAPSDHAAAVTPRR